VILAGLVAVGGLGVFVLVGGRPMQSVTNAVQAALLQSSADLGLRVRSIHLEGASPEASADIGRAVGVQVGAPLLGVDLEAVRRRIQQVGWVKSAEVIRLYPDTLVVAVDQRKLVAVWQHEGRTAVVDADGVVAPEASPAQFSSLPLVVGEGANTAAAAILPAVVSRPRLAARLEALVRVDDRRWDLRLKDGSIIQLPASDEEAALLRLDELDRKTRILDLGFSRIDLRDPQMVAVRPRQAMTANGMAEGVG
jgi:cell division protein FtsQ